MGDLAAGAKLGEYVIVEKLGAGGMGAVYRAKHVDGSEAALKVMHANAALEETVRKRFLREGRATQALVHPNVIRVLATFEHEGAPVIAMEVLHGMSLDGYLKQEGKLATPEMASIFMRVTSALGAAHALGLVHRDIKPDNVFLMEEAPFVKVLDFGIAKLSRAGGLQETSALTRTGVLVGSPFYVSPEQAFGEKDIDHRSDIWSLGIMLYQSMTGTLLTRAETLQGIFQHLVETEFPRLDEVDPTIPKEIADLVQRMLKRHREERPADLREVYEVLTRHASAAVEMTLRFEAAAPPQSFEDSGAEKPSSSTVVMPRSEPLKLTPQSLKIAPGARDGNSTVIMPEAAATKLASTLVGSSDAPATTAPEAKPDRGFPWLWIVAALIVLGAVAFAVARLV